MKYYLLIYIIIITSCKINKKYVFEASNYYITDSIKCDSSYLYFGNMHKYGCWVKTCKNYSLNKQIKMNQFKYICFKKYPNCLEVIKNMDSLKYLVIDSYYCQEVFIKNNIYLNKYYDLNIKTDSLTSKLFDTSESNIKSFTCSQNYIDSSIFETSIFEKGVYFQTDTMDKKLYYTLKKHPEIISISSIIRFNSFDTLFLKKLFNDSATTSLQYLVCLDTFADEKFINWLEKNAPSCRLSLTFGPYFSRKSYNKLMVFHKFSYSNTPRNSLDKKFYLTLFSKSPCYNYMIPNRTFKF